MQAVLIFKVWIIFGLIFFGGGVRRRYASMRLKIKLLGELNPTTSLWKIGLSTQGRVKPKIIQLRM